jgi:2-polyprenyl-3-methyl-5-hydroxy-6-metoxy-1,4-benzoquinol methylase
MTNPNDETRRPILRHFYDRNQAGTSRQGKEGTAAKINDVKRELKALNGVTQPQVTRHVRNSAATLGRVAHPHRPRMPPEQAQLIRRWHEESHAALRATLPADVMFMGLRPHITENVMPLDESPYHQAVEREARPGLRVLDMGSGVSALLAARAGSDVVAVDVNPEAVACARANARRKEPWPSGSPSSRATCSRASKTTST